MKQEADVVSVLTRTNLIGYENKRASGEKKSSLYFLPEASIIPVPRPEMTFSRALVLVHLLTFKWACKFLIAIKIPFLYRKKWRAESKAKFATLLNGHNRKKQRFILF